MTAPSLSATFYLAVLFQMVFTSATVLIRAWQGRTA
jgi:hypothetical protein